MPALPKVLLSVVILVFTLSTLTLTHPAFAQPDPPNPQPCKNTVETEKLTDNYLEPVEFSETRTGEPGTTFQLERSLYFKVDFSKLQALFGTSNSNYLEGRFQDTSHRQENILGLSSSNFNLFHGSGQKTAPKVMVDELRKNYVQYVYNKPTLAESANTYTDIEGSGNPKTIYDLVSEFGLPNPPEASADKSQWLQTWGRYWEKIPTAYSEFYEGKIEFRAASGKEVIEKIETESDCPLPIRTIKFVMPEFWRTTSISDQLNQLVVPCAAQSFRHGQNNDQCGETVQANSNQSKPESILGRAISFCKDLIANSSKGLSKTLKRAIKISLNFLNPVKTAFAQNNSQPPPSLCVKKTPQKDKEGNAPYCALPPDQLEPGDSCTSQNDNNKLDKENPNVNCTFQVVWTGQMTIPQDPITSPDPNLDCTDNGDGTFTCSLKVKIWPVFRIPWLAEIWNNTLYSDETEGQPEAGVGSQQETGRPGIYSVFTPLAVSLINSTASFDELFAKCQSGDQKACEELFKITKVCGEIPQNPLIAPFECFKAFLPKNLPGKTQQASSNDPKERFIGGTDCAKEFVRDIALKPKALQEYLGIEAACKTSD